jgi:hypothetical protein
MTSETELQELVNFVRVDASDMKKALDLYMSDDAWPTGVFVRRYFKPKDGAAKQS